MKKKLIAIFIFFLPIINAYAQKDTAFYVLPKKNNFGVSLNLTINTLNQKHGPRDNPYPFCYYLTLGASPISNYRQRMYLNAFHSTFLAPEIEIYYFAKNKTFNSFGIGYCAEDRRWNNGYAYVSGLGAHGIFRNYFFNYQYSRLLLPNNFYFHPIIGIKFNYSRKILADHIPMSNGQVDTLLDNSNLFLVQIPIGVVLAKGKFQFSIFCNFNLVGYISGKHTFIEGGSRTDYNEKIDYTKLLFINAMIHDHIIFSNILLKIGYNF